MITLCLFVFIVCALSLHSIIAMAEKHSWERKICYGERIMLLARQREDRRLLAKKIALLLVVPLWLILMVIKDLAIELAELGWRRFRSFFV